MSYAPTGVKNARYGPGQYLTDIVPEMIAHSADVKSGMMTLGQLSRRLFGVPWNNRRLTHFLEIDVTGLGARRVAENIWLIEGEGVLDVSQRIVRSGLTLGR